MTWIATRAYATTSVNGRRPTEGTLDDTEVIFSFDSTSASLLVAHAAGVSGARAETLIDLTIIPHTVPKELCSSREIKVSFSRRQVHVQAIMSKQIYMAGELHKPIDPVQSTWTTDGEYITIVCVKENLCLYDGSKGTESDTH